MSHPTQAIIHLDNLAHNARAIADRVAPAQVMAVVKANAYGHGAVPVARHLESLDIPWFAVARLHEGLELVECGIVRPILVLGRLFGEEIPRAAEAGLAMTVFGLEDLDWIEAWNRKKSFPRPARVHVKMDTGMGRLGALPDEARELFARLARSPFIDWEGVYSHFATSDEADKGYAQKQLAVFNGVLDAVPDNARPSLVHMANSGAILDLPPSWFHAVRPGIILYGHYPSPETGQAIVPKQVMTLASRVDHLRRVPKGTFVSYGCTWQAPEETTLAVVPAGYADGVRRDLSNKGQVMIRGQRFPLVGRVTMDHILVDVGDVPVALGDEVVFWGPPGKKNQPKNGREIQAAEVANLLGTIPYELTCSVSARVRRIYKGGDS